MKIKPFSLIAMVGRGILISVFSAFAFCSCKPQVLKDTTLCYTILNQGDLILGDTLAIYNCSQGNDVWLSVEKDSLNFLGSFTVIRPSADNYWRFAPTLPGTYYCKIQVGYEGVYSQIKQTLFTIKVNPAKD